MKKIILNHKKALSGTLGILLIGAVTMSFQDSPFAYSKFSVQEDYMTYAGHCPDTIPGKESMKMKDFEKLQSDLDKTLIQVTEELKKMNLPKMKEDIELSLRSVDMEKIRLDVERALKSIDMEKIMADAKTSLSDIELGYNNAEIEKSFAEARKEIDKARLEIKDIDKDAIRQELDKARKDMEKAKLEISKIDMDQIMTEARTGIEKAKEELKLTKEMFDLMEKEGLVSSKKGFTVEYKNKELYIDGKKQSEKTTDKYRKYFNKDHFKITIEKD